MSIDLLISITSAVVSAICATLTIWITWHNRKEADWTITRIEGANIEAMFPGLTSTIYGYGEADLPQLMRLTNTGDGDAYSVNVNVNGGHSHFFEMPELPIEDSAYAITDVIYRVEPAETVHLLVWDDQKNDLNLTVHWNLQPTRLNKTAQRTFYMRGVALQQPAHPIVHRTDRFAPTVCRWKLEHSRMGQWLHTRTQWAERIPFVWRTYKPENQQDTPTDLHQ